MKLKESLFGNSKTEFIIKSLIRRGRRRRGRRGRRGRRKKLYVK